MDSLVTQLRQIDLTDLQDFPFAAIVEEFQRAGKQHVSKELLAALNEVRARNVASRPPNDADRLKLERFLELQHFLAVALDKWDGRYAYGTYLGLPLLPLPSGDEPAQALASRNRLVALLISDALRFEIAAADEHTDLLPRLRPTRRTVAKRLRLGLRTLPSEQLGGLTERMVAPEPLAACRYVCEALAVSMTPDERSSLHLSMLPVDVIHDEYLFIRVLQAFEATFAAIAVQLRAAIQHLTEGAARAAVRCLTTAATTLHHAAPLFAVMATMQVEAFRSFRILTEGASAIQSSHAKTVEALCRRPDGARLDSPAYKSVPTVRHQVLAGQIPNLEQALHSARLAKLLPVADHDAVAAAMRRFGAAMQQWRTTHYRLAARMLGPERPGTGATEGTAYLRHVLTIPIVHAPDVGAR